MKILYAGQLSERDSALYRLWALERLGHGVVPINSYAYESRSALLRKVVHRLQMGPGVEQLNLDVLAMAQRERPDVFWADKLLGLQPKTLVKLRQMGVKTVSYMIDNAFGPRRDPGWRLYMRCIPEFDLHVVQRDSNIADYMGRGARDVIKVQTAYEPTMHFPSDEEYVARDATRGRGVSFIGTAYDDRPEFLTKLWRECGFPVVISGSGVWKERLDKEAAAAIYTGGELYGAAYREAVWDAKVSLSFLTHSNQDEFAHKSFEIAACGGFLLAERSAGHLERFVEDEEAVFFTGFEECAEKIRRYLPDAEARGRIAVAGRERAVRSGYGNDAQMGKIVARVQGLPCERNSSNIYSNGQMNKSTETAQSVRELLAIAAVLVIGYCCRQMLRFTVDALNSILACVFYAIPFLAIRPIVRLRQRPRIWGLVLLSPLLLLSSLLLLGRVVFGRSERTQTLQAFQEESSTVELQRYENGGAIGVHGLNLEQRRLIVPGLYIVKSIDFFDEANDAALSVEGLYTVSVHAKGSYASNDYQVEKTYHLRPWVYF